MKPPRFDWFGPETLDEALSLLADHGDDARILAGGQSLISLLNFRRARPAVLVDLNRIKTLAGISAPNGMIRIGAMTRQRQAERDAFVAERAPLLADALPHVAYPQIRNRGTIGGSLAHADPAAELPAVMLALDATFRLRSLSGERAVTAADFFTGLHSTVLRAGEILFSIDVPVMPARAGHAFEEISRRHGGLALLAVAAVIRLDAAGRCSDVRLAYVNAGDGPRRSPSAEATARAEEPRPDLLRAVAAAALTDLDPPTDVHASAAYRLQLARVLTERALARAFDMAARTTGTARP